MLIIEAQCLMAFYPDPIAMNAKVDLQLISKGDLVESDVPALLLKNFSSITSSQDLQNV